MRSFVLLSVLVLTSACSASTQQKLGAGVALTGLGTMYVAGELLTTCVEQPPLREKVCRLDDDPRARQVAVPMAFAGLGALLIGGAIVVAGSGSAPAAATPAPPPSEPPALDALDADEASGMAIAYLMLKGTSEERRPLRLQSLDERGELRTVGRRAELSHLRLRTAPDGTSVDLIACLAFTTEWVVESVGTQSCEL